MVERKGPAKGKFGGGFSGPRTGGAGGARGGYKAGGSREGGFDRKPREGGYDRKPREGGERSYAPRADGERKPYVKREGGERSYAPRADGERRPYVKREGGFDRKPREGGYERKSFGDGERKPYVKREGSSYERKPREGDERSYAPRGDGERRPYTPREGGYDRKPREGGYERKSFGDGERKPYVKREGGFDRAPRENRGEGKPARFSEKRTIKRDRSTPDEKLLMGGDGWLAGYHSVLAALTTGRRKVRKVWLLSEAQGELATILEKNPEWEVEIKSKPDFEREFGDVVHQGVAALVGNLPQPSLPELLSSKPKLIIALDQITDPHNLGAIVRSAAAFGAAGVLVTEHRAAGLNLTAAKVAAGAMEVVPVVEVTNLVQSLTMMQEAGYTVLGMDGEAETEIGNVDAKGPICLVMGSEGEGLRRLTRETCDTLVKIQISSVMESLNVSVATGVALSILTRK
jgi:23S rRNA (guanosine2251-2'-O)-methyltransferase